MNDNCPPAPKPLTLGCQYCNQPAIVILDGDQLCQTHADEWVRGEGEWAARLDEDGP